MICFPAEGKEAQSGSGSGENARIAAVGPGLDSVDREFRVGAHCSFTHLHMIFFPPSFCCLDNESDDEMEWNDVTSMQSRT